MSIGNSINSLPLAYAPLNATGRYVAYALAGPTVEAALTPLPSFVVDPGLVLDTSGDAAPLGTRIAPAEITAASIASMSSQGALAFFGSVAAATTAAIAGLSTKSKASAVTSITILAVIAGLPLRVRQGVSDFRSLYTPPGARSSGSALNTFTLNVSALNGRAGQHRRAFEILFTPTGSFNIASANSVMDVGAGQALTGNVLFGGFADQIGQAAFTPLPNAIFDPNPSLDVVAGTTPFGVALRGTGGTFDQALTALTALPNFVAGPSKTLSMEAVLAPVASALRDSSSGMDTTTALAALAILLAGGVISMDSLTDTSIFGARLRLFDLVVLANSYMDGVPWEALPFVFSTVYFEEGESIVYYTAHESAVYKPTLESTVYGDLE